MFMNTPISWGKETIDGFIPASHSKNVVYLKPPAESRIKTFKGSLHDALDHVLRHPIGGMESFDDLIKHHYVPGKPVVFATDDYTRPNEHTKIILPMLLERVKRLGIPKSDVRILIATGTHRLPKESEYPEMVGLDIWTEYKLQIVSHDCEKDVVMIGESDAGTPMGFNKLIFDCTMLVPVTDSELHYFAGVAGTIKEICPGIASKTTVSQNHPKMFDRQLGFVPGCKLGNTAGNPVITDIKNMVSILKKRVRIFGVDTVVNEGEIIYVNAGDLVALHEEAVKITVPINTVHVPSPGGDLVIAGLQTWGINLYQAGKGIHAAWNATRKDGNGKIVILAPCPDGVGNTAFEKTMVDCNGKSIQESLEFVLDHYCDEKTFKIGNQKPVDLLRIIKTVGEGHVMIVSDMDEDILRKHYRLDPIKKPGEKPIDVLKRVVNETIAANPDARIYLLDDPGLNVIIDH